MNILIIILYIVSVLCLLVAAVVGHAAGGVTTDGSRPGWVKTNWVAAGLAVFVFVFLLSDLTGAGVVFTR